MASRCQKCGWARKRINKQPNPVVQGQKEGGQEFLGGTQKDSKGRTTNALKTQ